MDIKLVASIGFAAEVASSIFILLVIIRQITLFKYHVQKDLIGYRKVLFAISIICFIGSILTMLIDLFTLLDIVKRTTNYLNPIGALYFLGNTSKSLLLSLLLWILYRMAGRTIIDQSNSEKKAAEVE